MSRTIEKDEFMFGMMKRNRKTRRTSTAVRCEMLENRNLTTGGLMGSFNLTLEPPPPQAGLLLPAVQKVR